MKVSFVGGNPREMLPRGERISNLFITGDVRGTEMPGNYTFLMRLNYCRKDLMTMVQVSLPCTPCSSGNTTASRATWR